jgi:DNA-binding transcriptional ArsR family regulator
MVIKAMAMDQALSAHPRKEKTPRVSAAVENTDGMTRPLDLLDDVIHQKVRLGIMSCLLATSEAEFAFLKSALMVSDGNLSTHLSVLEDAGYVASSKTQAVKRPGKSRYALTSSGRLAFAAYVAALESLVRPE